MVKPLTLLRVEPEGRISLVATAEGEAEAEKVVRPLKITNVTEGKVAWKVRTDAPEVFLVKPRSGVLDAGQSVEAQITRLVVASEKLASTPKFEVRAVAVEADCEGLERDDWNLLRASSQEAGYVVAVCRAPGSLRMSERSSGIEARDELADLPLGDVMDSGNGRDRRRANGRADSDATGGEANQSSWRPQEDDGFDFSGGNGRGAYSRRSADAPRSLGSLQKDNSRSLHGGRTRPDESGDESGSFAQGSDAETVQMGTTTKAIVGLLIVILLYNLYLRPLVQAMFNGESAPPPGSVVIRDEA